MAPRRRFRKKPGHAWESRDYRDSPEVFKARLATSMAWREAYEGRWNTVDAMLEDSDGLEQWTTGDFDFDMTSGFVVSTVETTVAAVCQPNPKITLSATVPDQEEFASAADRLVNSYWTRYNFGAQFLMGIHDAETKGQGCWKTLWKREVENVLLPDEQVEQLVQEAMGEVAHLQGQPALVGGRRIQEMSDEEIAVQTREHYKKVRVERVVVDRPMTRRVSPWLVFVDPDATCNEDLRWVCEGVWMAIEGVQENERFNKAARMQVVPTSRNLGEGRTDRSKFPTDPPQRRTEDQRQVLVWEYWSIEDGVFAMWADGSEEYLLRPTDIPYLFGHPYVFTRPNAPPDRWYGIPAGWRAAKAEMQANYTLTQRTAHANQYANKYVFDDKASRGAATETALRSVTPNEVVPLDIQPGSTVANSITALRPGALPPETYATEEAMKEVWHRTTAMDQYSDGQTQNLRRTAEEATMLAQAGRDRFSWKTMMYEKVVGDLAKNIVSLAQQFMSSEEVVQEVGEDDSSESWTKITPEDLQQGMRFNYSVEMGSLAPADSRSMRRDSIELFQMLMPLAMGPEGQPGIVNPQRLVEDVLKAFGKQDPSRYMTQQEQQQQPGQQQQPPQGGGLNA